MAITPFTKQQLLPQEEKLEVYRHKSELFIGIPKETSYQERRICLTPDAVNSLTSHGHIQIKNLVMPEQLLPTTLKRC